MIRIDEPPCDCGGESAGEPHYQWCSLEQHRVAAAKAIFLPPRKIFTGTRAEVWFDGRKIGFATDVTWQVGQGSHMALDYNPGPIAWPMPKGIWILGQDPLGPVDTKKMRAQFMAAMVGIKPFQYPDGDPDA